MKKQTKTQNTSRKTNSGSSAASNYAVKFAVSLPAADFSRIEALRKQLKMTRSEWIRQAANRWFQEQKETHLLKKYAQGYEQIPEDPNFAMVMENLQSYDSSSGEDW